MDDLSMLDEINGIDGGSKLYAARRLLEGESYLADHFPGRPVMPGVLMLEALVQAASWLVREKTGFRFPVTVLTGVRSLRYGRFVTPGDRMDIEVELLSARDNHGSFKGRGTVGGRAAVSGRFELKWSCPPWPVEELTRELREQYRVLRRGR
jgi:3-hydroxyacyl-[acyl-carrier-protein] dehydratase